MNTSLKPKELAFPERKLGKSPSFAPWNLVEIPEADKGRDGALDIMSQDVDMN